MGVQLHKYYYTYTTIACMPLLLQKPSHRKHRGVYVYGDNYHNYILKKAH